MQSNLKQLHLPESVKTSEAVVIAGGYAMNNGMGISGPLPYPAGQPYRVPELRVISILEGEGSLIVNLVKHDLGPGDYLVVPAGTIIEPVSFSPDARVRLLSSRTESTEKPLHIHPEKDDQDELEPMLRTLWKALHTEPLALDLVRFQFLAFIAKLKYIHGLVPRPQSLRAEEIFQMFIEAVNSYVSQNRRLPFFADKLGITPHHLSAVVKDASGESAMSWIHKATVQRAKLLLSQGMTALQVSEALEFPNAPYFNRYFKRLTGQTPGEYQKL